MAPSQPSRAAPSTLLMLATILLVTADLAAASGGRQLFAKRKSASARTSEVPGWVFSGEGTQYSKELKADGAKGFTCSYPYLGEWARKNFAAINIAQWGGSKHCGRCVKVQCVDQRCSDRAPVYAFIVDQCPTCAAHDLDFGLPVWTDLSGLSPDRIDIAWNFTSCKSFIDGTIIMTPKDGSQTWWQAFHFSNSRYRFRTVKLNGVELERSNENFWVHNAKAPAGPFTFELTTYGGSVGLATVNDLFKEQDLGMQIDSYRPQGARTAAITGEDEFDPESIVDPDAPLSEHPEVVPQTVLVEAAAEDDVVEEEIDSSVVVEDVEEEVIEEVIVEEELVADVEEKEEKVTKPAQRKRISSFIAFK